MQFFLKWKMLYSYVVIKIGEIKMESVFNFFCLLFVS